MSRRSRGSIFGFRVSGRGGRSGRIGGRGVGSSSVGRRSL